MPTLQDYAYRCFTMAVVSGRLDELIDQENSLTGNSITDQQRADMKSGFYVPERSDGGDGIDLAANRQEAANLNPLQFRDHVKSGSKWDYKTKSHWQFNPFTYRRQFIDYEQFGNFHYGFVAAANHLNVDFALWAAGNAQQQSIRAGTPNDNARGNIISAPWGDDPRDQVMIMLGYQFYNDTQGVQ